jgi:nucleotide-binding universal stress UspA family protein
MSVARPKPIVVGVDDSTSSREAVVYAAWEAERRGVPLRMVHGYVVPTPCLTPLAPLLDEQTLLASARDRLAQTAQVIRSRRPRLPLESRAVGASGVEALVRESATASLVVVGKPRQGGLARSPIGSVATQVVVNACCPVLVVPRSEVVPAAIPGAGPVLVGVDGSTTSEAVLGFGFEQASARGVPLVAAHVWSVPELTGLSAVGGGVEWDCDRDQAQAQVQETAERTLAEALAGWQERYPEVTVRRWVIHSFGTARVLLDVAREISAGLLVAGSRGRGVVAGAVLGSVSQVLVSHAVAPVAVIGPLAGSSVQADLEPARTGQSRT